MKRILLAAVLLLGLPLLGAAEVEVSDLASSSKPAGVKLAGAEAKAVLAAFNALGWDHSKGNRCHEPAYRIRILDGDTPLIDATISFSCHNARFTVPEGYGTRGFAAGASADDLLVSLLDALEKPAAPPAP